MGNHRSQDQFDRSRWRAAILVPMWLAEFALLLALIGIFAYRLAETVDKWDDEDKKGMVPAVLFAWQATNVSFSFLSLILTIVEVARYLAERLTPSLMLVTQIIKLTCAFAILGLDIVVYINRSDGHWSIVGLILDVVLLAGNITAFTYAILVFRRLAAYDDYHHPANAKHYGYRGLDETTYATVAKNNADSYDGLSYQSQTTNMATFKSSQSMGGGETGEDDVGAVPLDTLKRDTAFDVYVQQQQQQQQQQQFKATANDGLVSRDGTERGTASEFGWQGAAATVPSTSGPAGNVISDSLPRVQSPEPANNMQQESAGNDDSSRRVSVAAVGGGAFRSDSIASTLSTPYTPTMALDYDSPYQQGQGSGIQPQPSRTPSIVLSSGTVASGMPVIGGGGSHPGGVGMSIGRTGSAASMRAYVGVAGSGEGSGLVSVPEGAEGDDDDRNVVQGTEARRGDQRALLDDDYA